MEATQEVDLCPIEPSHKVIGGQTCQKRHMSMWRSVINVKDLHQTYTNQEESLTPFPALGHLLNGAYILLAISPR